VYHGDVIGHAAPELFKETWLLVSFWEIWLRHPRPERSDDASRHTEKVPAVTGLGEES
jgi:hypothetical protein